jgi:putative membrane protein
MTAPLFAVLSASFQFLAQFRGFLGNNSSLMLDVVFLAMFAVLPLLALSIYLVKQKQYALHKRINLVLGIVLLIAVLAFEVEMRFFTEWEDLAKDSPYFDEENAWGSTAGIALIIHLCFAIPTLFLWIYVIVQALRKFPSPPLPGSHSQSHKRFSWLAAGGMFMTAITGGIFYYLAFVATRGVA